jgi:LemA protein
MQRQDEAVKAAWSEVLNQYQRRADLVPNLVNTVKGYAQHEEKVFVEVTNARAKVGSLQVNADTGERPRRWRNSRRRRVSWAARCRADGGQ